MYIFGVPPKIYIRILLIFPVFWVQYSRFSLLTVLPLSSICQYSRFFTQPGMPLTYPNPCQSSVKPGIDFKFLEPSTLHWNARGRDGNFFSHASTPKMSKALSRKRVISKNQACPIRIWSFAFESLWSFIYSRLFFSHVSLCSSAIYSSGNYASRCVWGDESSSLFVLTNNLLVLCLYSRIILMCCCLKVIFWFCL